MSRTPFAAALALVILAGCSRGGDEAPRTTPPVVTPSATATASPTPARTPTAAAPSLRAGRPRLEPIGRFDQPLYVTAPRGDDRLFVVEKTGKVRVVRDGQALPTPFLDIAGEIADSGEQGLLSIAFAPDYATSRLVYVSYTDREGDSRIVEFAASASDPNRVDPASRRELLEVTQPFDNHNGGLVAFDPSGMLIVGFGDGGSGGDPGDRGQKTSTLLGKLLRIDPRRQPGGAPYGVPADNPFVGRDPIRPEIWALGLRNPWRFAFGPDGTLYLADVGQGEWEEINVVPPAAQAGANYGWRNYEADEVFRGPALSDPKLVFPVVAYQHEQNRCSVTGGVVYGGSVAALRGRYLYGDFCTGEIWSIPAGAKKGAPVRREPIDGGSLSSFGVDGRGEVYVTDLGGAVWRITAG